MRTLALAAVLAAFSGHALAQQPDLRSVDGLKSLLTGMGHSVVDEAADDGPNLVVDGGKWSISLAGCTVGAGCTYGGIYARQKLDKPLTMDCANEWNGAQQFGDMWIDGVGAPWLTATLILAGHPDRDNVAASLEWFDRQLIPFSAHVADCSTWGEENR